MDYMKRKHRPTDVVFFDPLTPYGHTLNDGGHFSICQVFFRSFLLVSDTNFLLLSRLKERLALADCMR